MPHQQFQSCIDACNACALACEHCAASCLKEKEVQQMARCIQLDIDCAEICRLATAYMGRGSELSGVLCEVCAQVCDACAHECLRYTMEHCQDCARACRRCAEECRRIAQGAGSARSSRGASLPAH
jgi:hypothetical protein